MPFALSAEAAGAQLDLKGRVALPITSRSGELQLLVKGERLDSMNKLARVELPPWGPWSFGGSFRASPRGYEVPDLQVRMGSSSLNGHGKLDGAGERPRLDVALTAPRVQLNDFQFGAWSPFEKKESKSDKPMSVEEMRAKAREGAAQAQKVLSRETLLRADAFLDVAVEQVLSGADQLGSGKLHAQLENARLEFGPADGQCAGRLGRSQAQLRAYADGCGGGAQIRVDRFDYGILARRIKPDTDLQGLFSLNVGSRGGRRPWTRVMAHANGNIDFAVWPKNMRSGIFDLWAVNLFVALAPAVDPAKESEVNCALGRFDLRDGKLTQDAILMDTSRMRVTGEGSADFAASRWPSSGPEAEVAAVLQPGHAGAGERQLHRLQGRRRAGRGGRNRGPAAVLAHSGADAEAHRERDPARWLGYLRQRPARGADALTRFLTPTSILDLNRTARRVRELPRRTAQ